MSSTRNISGLVSGGLVLALVLGFGIQTVIQDRLREDERRAIIGAQLPSYPLRTCVVSTEALDPLSMVMEFHAGRLALLCNNSAALEFRRQPRVYLDLIAQAVIREQRPRYPLQTCIVSKEPLGSMGEIVEHVHGTRLARFCCDGCIKSFEKGAPRYLSELDAAYLAAARAEAGEGLHLCPVTKVPLTRDSLEFLYGTRRVLVAEDAARSMFEAEPWRYLDELDEEMARLRPEVKN